ncbi:hypothetical protein Tco_1200375 [Tanacetum coccineum]
MTLESFQAPVGGIAIRTPASGVTRSLPVVEGKGKGIATDEQAAQSLLELHKPKKQSTTNQYIFQRQIPATQDVTTGPSAQPKDDTSANVVRDTPSHADAKTGKEVSKTMTLEERTIDLDEGQARSDPGKTAESRPPPEHEVMDEDQAGSDPGKSHVALAGPNHEPMNEDCIAIVYPQVHESLKHTTKEHVHMANPLSSTRTLSSIKNLDAFIFDDQFINDKSQEDEPGKANVETKVESMVTVPIYQASSFVPPLSTPIIDLSPQKPMPPLDQEPIITAIIATTTTTTTLPLPPPLL